MTDAVASFFDSLPLRGRTVLPEPMTGTIRIDLTENAVSEHWVVTFDGFQVTARHEMREADAIWTLPRRLFEGLLMGKSQDIAAILRNEATLSGNALLFLALRPFLPDRAGSRDPRMVPGGAEVARP